MRRLEMAVVYSAFTNTGYEDSDYFEAAYVNGSNKGKVIIVSRDFGEEPETVFGTAGFQIENLQQVLVLSNIQVLRQTPRDRF